MLRPKKKITKKEIQRDPFLESVDQAQAHLEENRSNYLKAGLVVLVLLIAYNVTSSKRFQSEIDASSSLGEALLTLDRKDMTTAQFQLETVLNDYENTPSASVAEYYLGKISYDAGNIEEAAPYLNSYFNSNPEGFLAPSAAIMLSDIAGKNGQLEDAIQILDRGMKYDHSKKDIRLLNLRKAQVELKQGNKDNAKEIVEKLLSDDQLTNWNKQIAQEIMGKIVS